MIPVHNITEDLSDLTRELIVDFPEASESILDHAIKRAFSQFCEKSHLWHIELTPITVFEDFNPYTLSAGDNFIILDVKRVSSLNVDIKQSPEASYSPSWRQLSMDTIELYGVDVDAVIDITVSIKPKEVGGVFKASELLLNDYRDVLLDGARAHLFKIPRKEWTDLNLFSEYFKQFQSSCSEAKRRESEMFSRLGNGVSEKPRLFY